MDDREWCMRQTVSHFTNNNIEQSRSPCEAPIDEGLLWNPHAAESLDQIHEHTALLTPSLCLQTEPVLAMFLEPVEDPVPLRL